MSKKVKVAHIITRMIIGGAQENTLYTVEGLVDREDCEVTLITGPSLGPEGCLLKDVEREQKYRLISVPYLRRNLNPFYDFVALIHLIQVLRKGGYDIVHTHSAKAGILGRIAAWIVRVPIIIHTIHGLAFHRFQSEFRNKLYILSEKFVLPMTDLIVTVCDEMIRQCLEVGIGKKENFRTIYSGLDIDSFLDEQKESRDEVREEYHIQPDQFVIGKIGRLFHLKGHEYLLEAAKLVVDKCPQAVFLLIGGGILEQQLRDQAKELGIEKHIIFTGLVSPSRIPKCLTAMDLIVHVSLREGLPRVIPQAFLSEKAVVAYDIDGARDIIEHDVNGYLIEPKEIDSLANALIELVQDQAKRERFAQNGKSKALKYFSKEKMVQDIWDSYENLLLSKKGGNKVKTSVSIT